MDIASLNIKLAPLDIGVVVVYAIFIFLLAQYVSREKKGHVKGSTDYFLASRALPWWAIGASLIAANISAEQIIGMSGSGYAIGLGIASYEWMAAITLIIVGKFFLPVFLKNQIYTMPEFLQRRYGNGIQLVMALFWLAVYIFVNLTAILWLGSLAAHTVTGLPQTTCLIALGLFAGAYALYGGLKAIALTDVVQVSLLVLGGLVIAYIALERIGGDGGIVAGFNVLQQRLPEHFDMVLSPDSPYFKDLPGLSVLLGGMWIMNISYWGFNQYIIQRALAAKSIREAQKGIVLAAFLKLLMPVLVVLPGIAAVILAPQLAKPDEAYPTLMTLLPTGLLGLVFAALLAAIVASMGSKINSIATIFTMDIYRKAHRKASEHTLVMVGRITAVVALATAMITAQPLLGSFDQAFQYIQEYTGFFTPGICVIFLLGLFWKRATQAGALIAAIGSVALSVGFKYLAQSDELMGKVGGALGLDAAGTAYLRDVYIAPFMNRVGYVFVICLVLAMLVSLLEKPKPERSTIDVTNVDYSTSFSFKIASVAIVAILVALYATWW